MTNQLTEGQRIDVYEVVDNESRLSLWFNEFPQRAIHKYYIGRIEVADDIFDSMPVLKHAVQKCGYYLKVKSLNIPKP